MAVRPTQLDGGAHVMADHDNEIGMINADLDEVAIADGCCAHVPGIPCTPHHTTLQRQMKAVEQDLAPQQLRMHLLPAAI